MQRSILLFAWLLSCVLFSCAPKYAKYASKYSFQNKSDVPDYGNLDYWAAHPGKKDLSDSTPSPLIKTSIKDTAADVFFLHPTTFTAMDDPAWNADINDSIINAKTDYSAILYQASAFNECRLFAPRYRQANLKAYYSPDTTADKKAFDLAYQDLKTAFQYYLDHYNNGRPIIIASHSQGSTHAQRLLKEFFENSPLKNRLVVAYVIGMYIPNDYFHDLKICSDSLQTACIAGWRTYKRDYEPDFITKENGTCWVTNPLTWDTLKNYASYDLNEGGVITDFRKLRKGLADGQVHNGMLWINKPHLPGSFLLRIKNFHVGDINLYYMNIRMNMRERIRAWQLKRNTDH